MQLFIECFTMLDFGSSPKQHCLVSHKEFLAPTVSAFFYSEHFRIDTGGLATKFEAKSEP